MSTSDLAHVMQQDQEFILDIGSLKRCVYSDHAADLRFPPPARHGQAVLARDLTGSIRVCGEPCYLRLECLRLKNWG